MICFIYAYRFMYINILFMHAHARAFAPILNLGAPKGASIDRLSGAGTSAEVCLLPRGSAVWPQCWLCAVCTVSRVGCYLGGGYPVGVSISSYHRARAHTHTHIYLYTYIYIHK